MTAPDFEALRKERNARFYAMLKKLADEEGIAIDEFSHNHNDNACYCACPGPCEHRWDGETWESEDGCCMSATCSRCGSTAMSHDMRVRTAPRSGLPSGSGVDNEETQ